MNAQAAAALDQLRAQIKTQHDANLRYLWAVQMGKPTDGINASSDTVAAVQSIVTAHPELLQRRVKV